MKKYNYFLDRYQILNFFNVVFFVRFKIVYTNTLKEFLSGTAVRYVIQSEKVLKSTFKELKCIARRTGQSIATAVESILVNFNLKIENVEA